MLSELLLSLIESCVCEMIDSHRRGLWKKIKAKLFRKKLGKDINIFCQKNRCDYLDSVSFGHYLKHSELVKRVFTSMADPHCSLSNEEFIKKEIDRAHRISEAENTRFGITEEGIVRKICVFLQEEASKYYCKNLTESERYQIATQNKKFAAVMDELADIKRIGQLDYAATRELISSQNSISGLEAEAISDLLYRVFFAGQIDEFNDWANILKGKSNDLCLFHESIFSAYKTDSCEESINKLCSIVNERIRDNAIKTILPLIVYRKASLEKVSTFSYSDSLKKTVDALAVGDYSAFLVDEKTYENNVEVHRVKLNADMTRDEEILTKNIVVLYLYSRKLRNTASVMEELASEGTWFTRLLIVDRKVDEWGMRLNMESQTDMDTEINSIIKFKNLYDSLAKDVKVLYYSVIAKHCLYLENYEMINNIVPADISQVRPLSDYVLEARIKLNNTTLDEVAEYSIRNGVHWLLNSFFAMRKNNKEMISFCSKNKEAIETNPILLLRYLIALKQEGLEQEYLDCRKEFSEQLGGLFEYWNEILNHDQSENTRSEFIQACRSGKMNFLLKDSDYWIVERLLSFGEYELAGAYIRRLELFGEKDYRIEKYKAIIAQSTQNSIEAIELYKESFDKYDNDPYVIDALIVLSLQNNRKIEQKVIEAAQRIDTARFHMLAAAGFMSNGSINNARMENIRAILSSEDSNNSAFCQFIAFENLWDNNTSVNVSHVDANTAAYCKSKQGEVRCICVYRDNILPTSPFLWNGDIHILVQDAARLGYFWKSRGSIVNICNIEYIVDEIVPLETYFFKVSIHKMTISGKAKAIAIPMKDGKIDTEYFTNWMADNTPDGRMTINWLEQYNNTEDAPLPLYAYKRFTNLSLSQFLFSFLNSRNYFVREMVSDSTCNKKVLASFSTIVLLYLIGIPVEVVVGSGVHITSSAAIQIKNDAEEMITEYAKDTVASLGVLDGKPYYNTVDEAGKEHLLKEAGSFKKFSEAIPTVENDKDLKGPFFEPIIEESKELFGICDYDAIAFVQNNKEYSLLTIEAILTSLSINEKVNIPVLSVVDWMIEARINVLELLEYLKKMIKHGCLLSINGNVIEYVSDCAKSVDGETKEHLCSGLSELLNSMDELPEKMKNIAIQSLNETLSTVLEKEHDDIEEEVLRIFTSSILYLNRFRVSINTDEQGSISARLVRMDDNTEN